MNTHLRSLAAVLAFTVACAASAAGPDVSGSAGDVGTIQPAQKQSPAIDLVVEDPIVQEQLRKFPNHGVKGARLPLTAKRQALRMDRTRKQKPSSGPKRIVLSSSGSAANIVNRTERMKFRDTTEHAPGELPVTQDLTTRQSRVETLRRAAAQTGQAGKR
jgi:hypothetical protein